MYIIYYSDKVIKKDIPQLSGPVKSLIKETINNKLLKDPIKFGKPLRYSLKGCRSLRIGEYRVIYQIIGDNIHILVIQHCKDCYKFLVD
jgi:addiction module RelE/StbE family toxin